MRWTSAALVVLSVAWARPAAGQPAPRPLPVLDVPFISQTEALCGGAAAAMVLRYWGERGISAESFASLLDRRAEGIRTGALIRDLRSRGWNATGVEGDDALLAGELARGRPVMALIEDRRDALHYVVVVAATADVIVFHDPARAPMRVMRRDEFSKRWRVADRWMAVVVPGERLEAAPAEPVRLVSADGGPCDRMIAAGIERAQGNDLEGAERSLTMALACPGGAALRELAGVRFLEKRWSDAEALAQAAVSIDERDEYAWRLLGTSRFLQDDRDGALVAWNHVAEPRVDVVRVDGLQHIRQRVVERLIGVPPGRLLTADGLRRGRRRLEELPAATLTRVDFAPVSSGLAELRASVNERPLVPPDVWGYAAIGLMSAARREVVYSTGSITGGGEQVTGRWRFWPGRPAFGVAMSAPAPWGGVLGVDGMVSRQPFDRGNVAAAERTSAHVQVSNWLTAVTHLAIRGGVDRWKEDGTFGSGSAALRFRSGGDRLDMTVGGDLWAGRAAFSAFSVDARARSVAVRRGRVYLARLGVAGVTASAPLDIWPGGDTGHVRPVLLRAHPLLSDGQLRTGQLGRRLAYASVEAQHWWPVLVARIGAAAFVDTARVGARLAAGARGDVDVGVGARLAVPGAPGTFRADIAKGVHDGVTRWSFVYEP